MYFSEEIILGIWSSAELKGTHTQSDHIFANLSDLENKRM